MGRHRAGSFTIGKGWRKCIGKRITSSGDIKPCRWWLGKDERAATSRALQIEALWLEQGGVWSDEALEQVQVIIRGEQPQPTAKPCRASESSPSSMTLAEAFDRYTDHVKADRSKRPSTKVGKVQYLKMVKRSATDRPLASIGATELSAMVDDWRSREGLSAVTIRNAVAVLRQMFDWLDVRGYWEAPRRFDRIFKGGEQIKPKVETFSVDELAQLYAVANERWKALILCGLNFGFASMECATLQWAEVNLAKRMVKRERQKTGVEGQWSLWRETVQQLKPLRNGHDSVFTTTEGNPLVRFSGQSRSDRIATDWRTLTKRAKVSHRPFKCLRKTGATMLRAIDGIEVSEVYLAHAERGIARHYSTPCQKRMNKALAELRQQLSPMFKLSPVFK